MKSRLRCASYPLRIVLTIVAVLFVGAVYADLAVAHDAIVEVAQVPTDTSDPLNEATAFQWQNLNEAGGRNANFGFTEHTFWIRVRIADVPLERTVIVVEYPLLDDIRFYHQTSGALKLLEQSGDHFPFMGRRLPGRLPVFEIAREGRGPQTYYLRVDTRGAMQLPIKVMAFDQLVEYSARRNLLFGSYYGFMVLLAIVACIAVWQTRERLFAYYTTYLVSIVSTMFTLNGYGYMLLWPGGSLWASLASPFFVGFACLFGGLFAANFLRADLLGSPIRWSFRILYAGAVVSIALCVLGIYPLNIKVAVCTGMYLVPVVFGTTVVAFRRKIPGARYFIVAWGIFLGAILLTGCVIWGLVPINLFTSNIMQITSMVDVIILSMALVERGRILRDQKESAIERANSYLSSMNEQLEAQVEERTKELTQKNEALRNQAIRDSLTGLLNHKAVMERLKEELSATTRFNYSVAVIMIDIDHFKSINDKFGHQMGDKVLQEISLSLRSHLRHYDVCGRYGGDEFIVILSRASREESIQFAERLRADIAMISIPEQPGISVSASIGISLQSGTVHPQSAEELVANADRALYDAKNAGRDIVRFFPTGKQTPFVVQ